MKKLIETPLVTNTQNILAAVDIRTSGRSARYHDLVDLRIMPFGANFVQSKDFPSLRLEVLPETFEKAPTFRTAVIRGPGPTTMAHLNEILVTGLTRASALKSFDDWFSGMSFPGKITPLVYSWSKTVPFLENFFGWDAKGNSYMYDYFEKEYRDVYAVFHFMRDLETRNKAFYNFPKSKDIACASVVSVFGEEPEDWRNVFGHCRDMGRSYQHMLNLKLEEGVDFYGRA